MRPAGVPSRSLSIQQVEVPTGWPCKASPSRRTAEWALVLASMLRRVTCPAVKVARCVSDRNGCRRRRTGRRARLQDEPDHGPGSQAVAHREQRTVARPCAAPGFVRGRGHRRERSPSGRPDCRSGAGLLGFGTRVVRARTVARHGRCAAAVAALDRRPPGAGGQQRCLVVRPDRRLSGWVGRSSPEAPGAGHGAAGGLRPTSLPRGQYACRPEPLQRWSTHRMGCTRRCGATPSTPGSWSSSR